MGKLTPGLSVEARANRESRMLRQVACPVRGSAVGKPTRRKAGQAPHLDSIWTARISVRFCAVGCVTAYFSD